MRVIDRRRAPKGARVYVRLDREPSVAMLREPIGRASTRRLTKSRAGSGFRGVRGRKARGRVSGAELEVALVLDLAQDRDAQLVERALFKLANAFLADAKLLAQFLQRHRLVRQPALANDRLLARRKIADRLGEPGRPCLGIAQ